MRLAPFALAMLASPVAMSQTADVRPIVLNNVVRIEAPTKTGQVERGYGLIVAREGDVLWVATAEHVIRWSSVSADGRDYSPQIAVRMHGRTERFELAARPRWVANKTDLAFLPVRAPLQRGQMFESWREVVVVAGTRPEESVAILGSDHDSIEIDSRAGKIGVDAKRVVGLTGAKAQSGAPVATANGIVGLYLGSGPEGPEDAMILPMIDVSRGAAQREVPWQLSENGNGGVSSYVTRVCIEHIGPERPRIIVSGTQTAGSPESSQCADVHAGRMTLASADPEVACIPEIVLLAEQPTQQITVDCRVDIAGVWTNAGLGGGQFTPIASGIWSFEGLDASPYGRITGRVTGSPPRMYFDGRTAQGRPVAGFVSIERRQVSFSFTMVTSSTPFTGVLRR